MMWQNDIPEGDDIQKEKNSKLWKFKLKNTWKF